MSVEPGHASSLFERVLADSRELVRLANELEYQLHRLGEVTPPPQDAVLDCQQCGVVLVRALRGALYRQDQHVLPLLERLAAGSPPDDPPPPASISPE